MIDSIMPWVLGSIAGLVIIFWFTRWVFAIKEQLANQKKIIELLEKIHAK